MKIKKNYAIIIFSIMAYTMAISILYQMSKIQKSPKVLTEIEKLTIISLKILNNPSSTAQRKELALLHLAKNKHPKALEISFKWGQQKKSPLRAIAILALKNFPTKKTLTFLKKMIRDPDQDISSNAIKALAQNNQKDFEKILFELFDNDNQLKNLEKVALYTSIIESSRNMKYVESALNKLLLLAKHPHVRYSRIARKELARRMWSHPKVMRLMKTFLLGGMDHNFSYIAVKKFLKHEPKWLDENLLAIFKNNGLRVITIIRDKFYTFCPKSIWQAFTVALLKKNGNNIEFLKKTLHSLKLYDQKEVSLLLENVKLPKNFNKEGRREFIKFKKEIKSHTIKTPLCSSSVSQNK